APAALLGTPAVFRARTLRDYQQMKADANATPIATREFSRTDRIFVRVPAYGPGGAPPAVSVHLLNRAGQPMAELPAAAGAGPAGKQIELQLSGLAPGEYVLEIKATADGSDATEHVGFRVTS